MLILVGDKMQGYRLGLATTFRIIGNPVYTKIVLQVIIAAMQGTGGHEQNMAKTLQYSQLIISLAIRKLYIDAIFPDTGGQKNRTTKIK